MVNSSFPNMIKLGCTTKDPQERAKELSAASGVPTPYVLAYHRYVRDPFQVEAFLHRKLEYCRVNDSREFFKIPLHKAIELIDTFEEVVARDDEYPFAKLFGTFPDDGEGRDLTEDERLKCRELEARVYASQTA